MGCRHLLTRHEASSPVQGPIEAMPIAIVPYALDIGANSDKDEEKDEKSHLLLAERPLRQAAPAGVLTLTPALGTGGGVEDPDWTKNEIGRLRFPH